MGKNQIPKPHDSIDTTLQLEVDRYVVALFLCRSQSDYPEFMQKKQEALKNIGQICTNSDYYFLGELKSFCWNRISWFNKLLARDYNPDELGNFVNDQDIPSDYREAFPILTKRASMEKYILEATMEPTEDESVKKVNGSIDSLVIDDYVPKTKPMKIVMSLDKEFEIDFKTLEQTPKNSPRTPKSETKSLENYLS